MKYLFIMMIVMLTAPAAVTGQLPELISSRSYDALDFDYTSYIFPDTVGENSKLHLMTSVAFNRIQFLKYDDEFRAQYEVTVELRDDSNELIHGKTWIEVVRTNNFEETDSYTLHHFTGIKLPVTSGDYNLNVYLEDIETRKRIWRKEELSVPEYEDNKFKVSSVILVDSYKEEDGKIVGFNPLIYNTLENTGRKYFAYFEIIPEEPDQKFSVEAEIKTLKKRNKTKFELEKKEGLTGKKNIPVIYEIDSETIPTGAYEINFKIQSGREKSEISRDFSLSWFGIPNGEGDLDIALSQMKYAFEDVENTDIDELTFDEKAELFQKVWKERDPDPDTPLNEFKEEYFRRVRYANKYFTVFRDGWRTDRGLIYILFGPPSEIFRYEYNVNTKPFQTWAYYRENLVFQFLDRNGFGDFVLTTPYSIDALGRSIR